MRAFVIALGTARKIFARRALFHGVWTFGEKGY